MDELIDIIAKDGKPTGKTALKSQIHNKGYYHNTAHIWFYNTNGQILLAQRAASKAICPLLWDVSVAGHVDADETIVQAAIRETWEELGLKISETSLTKIGVFPCFQKYTNGIIDNEFHHTFICETDNDLTTILFNKEEVEAVKLVNIPDFKNLLNNSINNSHFVASNRSYYEYVIESILKHL